LSYHINNKDYGSIEEFVLQGRGCATTTPNHYQVRRNDERMAAISSNAPRPDNTVIPVRFIHITDDQKGLITEAQRINQIEILNEAYSLYGIQFSYSSDDVVFEDNSLWYSMDHGSKEERDAKKTLQGDPKTVLNFYTAGLSAGLLGWATFPWERDGDMERDGVVMLDSTLPGGSVNGFNLGKTAIHEVGHWLGLWHTFQGGCDAYGDHIGDTPAHASPNYGKPEEGRNNACQATPEDAPIHNFMNYVDDAWMTEFTQGQMDRAWDQIALYRSEFFDATA